VGAAAVAGVDVAGGGQVEGAVEVVARALAVELAGADYPGGDILPMEGASLAASFAKDENPDRTLLWEHYDSRAIRRGKWKLVGLTGRPWELYDIEADRSEMHDLTKQHPETAKELADLWEKEAHRTLIYPRPVGKK
jgi:arylsulfatase